MNESTPAELLRATAARLRETAREALGGPWAVDEDGTAIFSAKVAPYGAPCVVPRAAEEDAAWIVLVHPGLAEPLAAWLEETADVSQQHQRDPSYSNEPDTSYCLECLDEECDGLRMIRAAVAVACVILGIPARMYADTKPVEVTA